MHGEGACADVENILRAEYADGIDIVLSPRSSHRSAEILARHRQVRVAPDNQLVVRAADIAVRIGEVPFLTMVGVRAITGSPAAGRMFKALEIP